MATKTDYRLSWIDKIIDFIDSLPISASMFFILLYAACALIVHAALWAEAYAPFGSFSQSILFDSIWVPLGLGYLYYLKQAARDSIMSFLPVLKAGSAEAEAITYRFTTLPSLPTLLLSLLGLSIGLYTLLTAEVPFSRGGALSTSQIVWALISGGGYTFLPIWIYAAIRHLRQISHLFGKVREINLFNLQPLYGLSRVTMIVGGFFVLNANLNYLWETFLGTPSMTDSQVVGVSIIAVILALIVVLLPLWGIHRKIQNKKENMLAENAMQVESTYSQLQADIKKKKLASAPALDRTLNALFAMRTKIETVPAWPWNPGAFRNFTSAVMLPILIWLAQRFLSQLF